ncbi:MAG: primosomal protein N' [bacterium]|nr:primosomal protein N' [bacterium]
MLQPVYADVAVPVPIHGPLTYRVPEALGFVEPGCRVRVTLARRRLIGVVLALRSEAPQGFEVKDLLEVLDLEPVLTEDLLELARFVADYYLAPIGEALRAMIPANLPPWGNRRVSLTDAGAIAPPRGPAEARLIEALFSAPRSRVAELQKELRIAGLGPLIDELHRLGRVTVEEPGGKGMRYVKAVELRSGEWEAQLAACGRSPQGRAVLEYLRAVGRPATIRELTSAVGCGAQVVRRLISRDLLRQFTQPERLSLERHRLSGRQGAGQPEASPIILRSDQAAAVAALAAALRAGRFASFLLRGITGSGKTEVYLRIVAEALERGQTAIILVPEIALVPALARTAGERFGHDLAILHSNLAAGERHQEWERVRRGEARVVLGPRSALFAPLDRLGVIVVDEEHDNSYKQEIAPRYNGRDLALLRARANRAVVILVSATPSLESRHNVDREKLRPLVLTARAGHGRLPEGILVDLRREEVNRRPGEVHYSELLRREVEEALDAGDQVILLRNRRGYSPILLCRACGEDFRCPDCGLPFTYHRRDAHLGCHYCGRERAVPPVCPQCGEAALDPIGAGTERVEEQFQDLFPGVTVDVLDSDATRRPGGAAAVLERFASGRTQVLIGTQMVSKGHHFPRVALAAVLFADTYLGFPDFRAVERTYGLLTQLAGRAGRGERRGRVVIQTFHPDHYAIRAALEHDDAAFAEEEMRFRRTYHYPPFTRMVQLLVAHPDRLKAQSTMREICQRLYAHPLARDVLISGPAAAPLERLRGKWRFQLLLRSASASRLRRLLHQVAAPGSAPDLVIDVDPYDLM